MFVQRDTQTMKLCLVCSILLKDEHCRDTVVNMGCSASRLQNKRSVWSWQADGFEAGLDILMLPNTSLQLLPLALLPNPSPLQEPSFSVFARAAISADPMWYALKLSFSEVGHFTWHQKDNIPCLAICLESGCWSKTLNCSSSKETILSAFPFVWSHSLGLGKVSHIKVLKTS